MRLLVQRCVSRAHVVEELLEHWQADKSNGTTTGDTRALVKECAEFVDVLADCWERLWSALADGDGVDYLKAGSALEGVLNRSRVVFERIAATVTALEKSGRCVPNAVELRTAIQRLAGLEAEFRDKWPKLDREMIRASKEAYHRGEYQSTEDMLHELQDDCAQAHQ